MLRPVRLCPACRSVLRKSTARLTLDRRRPAFSTLALINTQLINLHSFSALPWSLVIPLSTFCLSLVLFPIAYSARKNQVLMTALAPIMQSSTTDLRHQLSARGLPMQQFEAELKRLSRARDREIKSRHRVTVPWLLLPVAVKLPIWLSFSLTLRAMSGSSIPYFSGPPLERSLQHDPMWWFPSLDGAIVDLTSPDHLMILPFLFSLTTLLNLELQASQSENRISVVLQNVGRIIAVVMIPVAGQMPIVVCEYWLTSAILNLLQNLYLSWQFPKDMIVQESDGTQQRLPLPGIDDTSQHT